VEAKVVNELKAMIADPARYSQYVQVETEKFKAGIDATVLKIREAERELAEAEGERERLITAFQKGVLSERDLERRLPDVERRRKAVQQARYELGTDPEHADRLKANADAFIAWVTGLKLADFDTAAFETKQALVRQLVDKVTIQPDGSVTIEGKAIVPEQFR
jgi:hypothetical protein